MSALDYIHRFAMPAALALLDDIARALKHPAAGKLAAPAARAMLLAIGLQESRFEHRKQIRGPALSFYQAESGGGFRGILSHRLADRIAREVLLRTGYGEPDESDFYALEDNDIVATSGARLLLWTHPKPLPGAEDTEYAWQYYRDTWRPGRPHRETWDDFYEQAWDVVNG